VGIDPHRRVKAEAVDVRAQELARRCLAWQCASASGGVRGVGAPERVGLARDRRARRLKAAAGAAACDVVEPIVGGMLRAAAGAVRRSDREAADAARRGHRHRDGARRSGVGLKGRQSRAALCGAAAGFADLKQMWLRHLA
jgi:hypothetical protein